MQIPSHACGFLQAAAEFDSKKVFPLVEQSVVE